MAKSAINHIVIYFLFIKYVRLIRLNNYVDQPTARHNPSRSAFQHIRTSGNNRKSIKKELKWTERPRHDYSRKQRRRFWIVYKYKNQGHEENEKENEINFTQCKHRGIKEID